MTIRNPVSALIVGLIATVGVQPEPARAAAKADVAQTEAGRRAERQAEFEAAKREAERRAKLPRDADRREAEDRMRAEAERRVMCLVRPLDCGMQNER